MIDLAGRLRLARENRGISQRRLGKLLGVCHATVSLWETAQVMPGFRTVERWAEAVGYAIKLERVDT